MARLMAGLLLVLYNNVSDRTDRVLDGLYCSLPLMACYLEEPLIFRFPYCLGPPRRLLSKEFNRRACTDSSFWLLL